LVPVTGGRAGLDAEGEAIADEIDESVTEESVTEAADERLKLVAETLGAAVEVYPGIPGRPSEMEISIKPLSASAEVDEAIKPETGSTSLAFIDWEVGTAETAESVLADPANQLHSTPPDDLSTYL
jgi:hypothetical protein